ncbi:MAG: HAD hydrolase-like protein [Actinomycetes bacterium]
MALVKMAIFDVAGTTAQDDGLVVRAFQGAVISMGIDPNSDQFQEMTKYVIATMGVRKIDVFLHLFDGNSILAEEAHEKFVAGYIDLVKAGELEEFEGVSNLFRKLREADVAIGITTGFPREILDRIISNLGWSSLIDTSVAASEVDTGRPAPDMILRSIELFNVQTGAHVSPSEVAVIGDTESDMGSGINAQVKFIVGVTSGAHNEERLKSHGATHVLSHSTDLFEVIA